MTTVQRICFFGDSITVGTGDIACRGWPSYACEQEGVERGHDVSCYNLGIRAETSKDIAKRWQQEYAPRLPAHVTGRLVFMFGVNDCAELKGDGVRVPAQDSLATAVSILSEAKSILPTLWMGMTPVRRTPPEISPGPGVTYRFDRERTEALNSAYRIAAAEIGIPYLDLHSLLAQDADWNSMLERGDGVHPDDDGHRRVAQLVTEFDGWRDWF
jgi:lysophospholipase L1-like esterase